MSVEALFCFDMLSRISCTSRAWCLQGSGFRLAAMSTFQNVSMPPERFLTIAANVLHKTLLDAQRAQAKRVFNDISEGKRVALLSVQMDDDTQVRFDLSLDHSEFRGDRLNFRFFRNSVANLVGAFGQLLEKGAEVPIFSEKGGGTMLLGVPGLSQDAGETNLMMVAVDLRKPGSVHLKLQYMDPSQVVKNVGSTGPPADQVEAS